MTPLISICIPAYKRVRKLQRLLRSIAEQTYHNYEIVITDDSPDDSVKRLVAQHVNMPIRYFHNTPALGTPANWNHGISLAAGEWIKLMHDDDWFRTPESLQRLVDKTGEGKRFIFSRYANVFEDGKEQFPRFPRPWRNRIIAFPVTLLAQNVIGPPSVTLIHSSIKEIYDIRMKWRVDIDFYIRLLLIEKEFACAEEPLVNVGIGSTQVTNDCINLPQVELPEGLLLLKKYGTKSLKHILVYDAWWRILRNTGIRSSKQLEHYTAGDHWPLVIQNMVKHQKKIPQKALRNGFISKPAMFLSYVMNQRYLRR